MSNQNRVQAGVPRGGQFAQQAHGESGVALAESPVWDDRSELVLATDAYLECALWASTGPDSEPLDDTYDLGDVAPSSVSSCESELNDFMCANKDVVDRVRNAHPEYGMDQLGHDFFLTRNGHGAGFWDRGLGDDGDRLTEAAHVYGSADAYVGDDEQIYFG